MLCSTNPSDVLWVTGQDDNTTGHVGKVNLAHRSGSVFRIVVYRWNAECKDDGKQVTCLEPLGCNIFEKVDESNKLNLYHCRLLEKKADVVTEILQNELIGPFAEITLPIEQLNDRARQYAVLMKRSLSLNKIEWHGLMHSFFVDPGRIAATPLGDGLPQIKMCDSSPELFWKQWSSAVNAAIAAAHFEDPRKILFNPSSKLMELVGCGALTLLAGPYPATHERNDDRGFAAFGLYSYEDCDGKGMNVCNNFTLLMKLFPYWQQNREAVLSYPFKIAKHFYDNLSHEPVFVHTMTHKNIATANLKKKESDTKELETCFPHAKEQLFGHIIVLLLRKQTSVNLSFKDALLVDGTCFSCPHFVSSEETLQKALTNFYKVEFAANTAAVGITGYQIFNYSTYFCIPIAYTSTNCIVFKPAYEKIRFYWNGFKTGLALVDIVSGNASPVLMPSNAELKHGELDKLYVPHSKLNLNNIKKFGIDNFAHRPFEALTLESALNLKFNALLPPYEIPAGLTSMLRVAPFVNWSLWVVQYYDYGTEPV